ncbi:hypothetical protein [Methylobacterium gossipiicola]|nr:hypothetical protein [Methylobacterium gossipiicola]
MLAEIEERMRELGMPADRQVSLGAVKEFMKVVGEGPIAPDDVKTQREEAFQRWAEGPRLTQAGIRAEAIMARLRNRERDAVQSLKGRILDNDGQEVRLTMQHMTPLVRRLAHLTDEQPGPNRAQRRAAIARARRRA